MIAYEIQLHYVNRDKIQFETKFSPRKNLRKIFFVGKQILLDKKIVRKNLSWMLSRISSAQSEFSRTNRCISSLSSIHMPQ